MTEKKRAKLCVLDRPELRAAMTERAQLFDGFEIIWVSDVNSVSSHAADGVILNHAFLESWAARLLVERGEAVAQLARGIGHEFGNILLRLVGKTDLALIETDVSKIHSHLQVVMAATERATLIVRNLQAFGKNEVMLQKGQLKPLIEQALETMSADIARYKVKVDRRFDKVPLIQLDPGTLTQAICNVILNALQSMHELTATGGGTLAITTKTQDGDALLRIKDGGCGIEEKNLPRIFEFGFTTRGARGGGIGLSIAKQILDAHHATMEVSSQVGKGTEVRIRFPGDRTGDRK